MTATRTLTIRLFKISNWAHLKYCCQFIL